MDLLRENLDGLMTFKFKSNRGLLVFIPMASTHLSSLMELAHQDHRVEDWTDCTHYKDYKKRAILYAEYVEAIYN